MLKPHGYITISDPDVAQVMEFDSASCCHCSAVIFVKPGTLSRVYLLPQLDGSMKEEPGAGCMKCGKPVCLRCHEIGTCAPIEKRLEFMEAVERNL